MLVAYGVVQSHFVKFLSSATPFFYSLPKVIWTGAAIVLLASVWRMGLWHSLHYVSKNRRWLFVGAVGGVATSLFLAAPWKARMFQPPVQLTSGSGASSLVLILVSVSILTTPRLTEYWRRYLRTLLIPDPPAPFPVLASLAIRWRDIASLRVAIFCFSARGRHFIARSRVRALDRSSASLGGDIAIIERQFH